MLEETNDAILKDSFRLFETATQDPDQRTPTIQPSLAETPENLFEELETKLDSLFASEKMRSAYE